MSRQDWTGPDRAGMPPLGRREFLETLGRAAAGSAALAALPPWVRAAVAAAATPPPELIERNEWPEHWETTLEALGRSWITSNPRFFVRSHFTPPTIDAAAWRLEIKGLVDTPLSLTLAELQAGPMREAVCTLECAGNGRGLYPLPSTSGTQWERGAVGTARWGGVRLATLLERAGVKPEAKHVWFEAADRATLPTVPPFMRSIPFEKAMTDTLLAHTMNEEPLPRLHGAPLRAIVPGWYGMAWTKWVTGIRLEAAPSDNHFMVKGYRYTYPDADPAQPPPPVEEMRIKSVITRPLEGARLPVGRGRVRVQGFAWTGKSEVRQVEISSDGGNSWRPAGFMGDKAPSAWRAWATEITVEKAANMKILARATDATGETQPPAARPNAAGYANNSIHQVSFHVGK